ncbi:CTD kinase subunit gamma CTK3-domain-containing protein [Dichomitus squalens]|uniref:CTD kinase subunit gamma CTK3-domain-containing protein n=1 Tax=Dichomitus squalens TaxID=114155 RepID=A0A4Q9MGH1_9APHY|nr:CTD kinase subunit gamma CTK3-domain-containing protein [Dichomitus squalens]
MDPFEVRMQFLALLRRLDASQQSIKKIVGFALKYFSSCGEDLWDCIVEECQKGSLNSRINILYLLDSLCETCLLAKPHTGAARDTGLSSSSYVDYLSRDLSKLVDYVVPPGQQGMPNFMSTVQVLESWRNKRVIEPQKLDEVLAILDTRRATASLPSERDSSAAPPLDPFEIKKRMEEDRERHKRLRERRWVQPISHNLYGLHPLASFLPLTDDGDGPGELTLDIEFDNEWETTSDWNEDDDEAIAEENAMCYPSSGEGDEMDLS